MRKWRKKTTTDMEEAKGIYRKNIHIHIRIRIHRIHCDDCIIGIASRANVRWSHPGVESYKLRIAIREGDAASGASVETIVTPPPFPSSFTYPIPPLGFRTGLGLKIGKMLNK